MDKFVIINEARNIIQKGLEYDILIAKDKEIAEIIKAKLETLGKRQLKESVSSKACQTVETLEKAIHINEIKETICKEIILIEKSLKEKTKTEKIAEISSRILSIIIPFTLSTLTVILFKSPENLDSIKIATIITLILSFSNIITLMFIKK